MHNLAKAPFLCYNTSMTYLSITANFFIYIAIIILTTVTGAIYVSHAINLREPVVRGIIALSAGMVIYSVMEMFRAVFSAKYISSAVFMFMGIGSDIGFFIMVGAWLYCLVYLMGTPFPIRPRVIIVVVAIYGVVAEIIGQFNAPGAPAIWGHLNLAVNWTFDVAVVVACVLVFVYATRDMIEHPHRNLVKLMAAGLGLYMFYIIVYDYLVSIREDYELEIFSSFDPVLLLCALACVGVIWLVRHKGTLGYYISQTIGIEKSSEKDWEAISREFKLTMRETEVAQLVYQGMGNSDIAAKLFISESTVKHHIHNLYEKTGRKGRYELFHMLENK